jgi:hypothetical protein
MQISTVQDPRDRGAQVTGILQAFAGHEPRRIEAGPIAARAATISRGPSRSRW